MKEVTVSAKNVADAVTKALIELATTSDELEYEIIEKGSDGFLGIGRKQAVIRAWKKEPEKNTVQDEIEDIMEDFSEVTKGLDQVETPEEPVEAVESPVVKEDAEKPEEMADADGVPDTVHSETIAAGKAFLEDTIRAMGVEARVLYEIDEDGALCFELVGKKMGILIGKRGVTLDALQYLTNRVANKAQESFVRVKLDTENYRARRQKTLERLAKNLANKAVRTQDSVKLEPMNPYERRIIHAALQGDKRVTTHSEGKDPKRRVVIDPVQR